MPTSDAVPATAFDLLSDETRVAIVRELAASEEPLAFSTLRDRAGIRDSGRFNYHLARLRGHLVARTPDGYALTEDGRRAARLL